MEVLDLHRRPGRVPAGRRPASRCSTRSAGVSDLARMDPAAVEEQYGVAPEHYRDVAALVGETSDNLPGVPGRRRRRPPPSGSTQFGGLDGVIAHVDEIKGKAGDSLREHLADVLRNYELNRLVDDLELPLRPGRRCAGAAGTARRCTRSSTRCSSGSCATGSTSTWTRSSRRPRPASTWPARCSRAGRGRPPGSTEHAPAGARSASRSPARSAAAPARSPASRVATARRPGRLVRPDRARRGRRGARSRPGSPTRDRPKVLHDAKPAAARVRRARLAAGRASPATPRSPPTWPGPTSAPTT